ncbi:MAG TPA: NAD-dependent epimerase/dehydratase family protein [Streptosporangiaceae bacterium]
MRILVAGATGVIGIRLVPLLVAAGHTVTGLTRAAASGDRLRALGAEPAVCDALDPAAVRAAVAAFGPDLVIDELTDLPDDAARIAEFRDAHNRIRREGIRNLIAATEGISAGLLSQSVAWRLSDSAQAAVEDHERQVRAAGGVTLRYGQLYGPGTFYEREPPGPPRIHVDEAARRTADALDAPPGSILTLVE